MSTKFFADAAPREEADIVIVGAGISGLYCAWRLIQQDPSRRITIIERLDPAERGLSPSDIVERVYQAVLAANGRSPGPTSSTPRSS